MSAMAPHPASLSRDGAGVPLPSPAPSSDPHPKQAVPGPSAGTRRCTAGHGGFLPSPSKGVSAREQQHLCHPLSPSRSSATPPCPQNPPQSRHRGRSPFSEGGEAQGKGGVRELTRLLAWPCPLVVSEDAGDISCHSPRGLQRVTQRFPRGKAAKLHFHSVRGKLG